MSVCAFAPLVLGQLTGRLDLGVIASLGIFAAMYTGPAHRHPLTSTATAAAALVAAMVVGGLVAGHPLLAGMGVAAFTAVCALVWSWGCFGARGCR